MPSIQVFERGGLAASEAQHQILVSLLRQAHSLHYQPPGGSGTYLGRVESGNGFGAGCHAGREGTTPIATKFSQLSYRILITSFGVLDKRSKLVLCTYEASRAPCPVPSFSAGAMSAMFDGACRSADFAEEPEDEAVGLCGASRAASDR